MSAVARETQVPDEHDGKRFDQALAGLFPEYSRSRLKGWIQSGRARLNGEQVMPRTRVQAGQPVSLEPEAEPSEDARPEAMALDLVHADDDVLVLNKPAGIVVHPGAGQPGGTLMNGLLYRFGELARVPRAGLLHRLDKDTSGLLLVARNIEAHTVLVRDLEARCITREYRAVCSGRLTAGGTIDAPVGRHPTQRTRMAVVDRGRPAVTHFRVLARFAAHSFVAVRLETGRTHQIRVHFAAQRHPLVGDPVYGGRLSLPPESDDALRETLRQFRRQALHASHLGFRHPRSGERLEFRAPMPMDLLALVLGLGGRETTAAQYEEMKWPEK